MTPVRVHPSVVVAAVVAASVAVSACSMSLPSLPGASAPPVEAAPEQAALPPGFAPEEIVGRWGFSAYHKDQDRARTEAAARGQCKQAYAIGRGPTGGVMMHLADSTQPEELRLKGGPGGKTYVGPAGAPGGPRDREVVSFDGRVLLLRWIDPEVAGRYGTAVYVRCGPRA
jgi:hypothetical protein